MNKIFKILLLVVLSQTFHNCAKREDAILVSKIIVEKEYCENCMAINRLKIKYIANTNSKIESILLSNKSKLNFKVYAHKKDKFGVYLYELVFDEISLSKFYTLNDLKKKYNSIIFFKKIDFINSRIVMKTTNKTKICYILNGEEIGENDEKMNYPKLEKVSPIP